MSLDLTTLRRRLQKALGKKFTVGNILGEGGFAAVFRVRDQDLGQDVARSEEHTSELQSQSNLVCRLLLEKKKAESALQSRESSFFPSAHPEASAWPLPPL